MAYQKKGMKAKQVRRKRYYKRKAARKGNMGLVNRALAPIPQRYITQLKYVSTFNTSAISPTWNWNLNSLFDPDRAGVGHQPYGYDQLAALYNRYRVISTSYVITGHSADGVPVPIRIIAIPNNGNLLLTTGDAAMENPRAKFVNQMPGGTIAKLTGKVYMPSLFGRTRAQYMADDRYQSQVNASPAELAILSVLASDFLNNPAVARLSITFKFTVEFFDVETLPQS